MDDDPIDFQAEEDERRYRNDPEIYNTANSMIQMVQSTITPEQLDCAYRNARRIIAKRIQMNQHRV